MRSWVLTRSMAGISEGEAEVEKQVTPGSLVYLLLKPFNNRHYITSYSSRTCSFHSQLLQDCGVTFPDLDLHRMETSIIKIWILMTRCRIWILLIHLGIHRSKEVRLFPYKGPQASHRVNWTILNQVNQHLDKDWLTTATHKPYQFIVACMVNSLTSSASMTSKGYALTA